MQRIRWAVVFRLALFGLLAVLLTAWLGIAWVYNRAVVWPACRPLAPVPAISQPPIRAQVTGHDGIRLEVHYYPSANTAAVIIYGGLSGPNALSAAQAAFLNEAGYGVLLVEPRPCADPPAPQTAGFHEGRDLPALAAYLIDSHAIPSGRIGVLGWSMGGASALIGAAHTPDIGAVIAEGNFLNYGELLAGPTAPGGRTLRTMFAAPMLAFFRASTGIDPYAVSPRDALHALAGRPVLLIYGAGELHHPPAELRALATELWVVPGGTHGANITVAPAEYPARILAFFDQHLLAD